LDYQGIVLWQKKYGGSKDDLSYQIQPTVNGYILVGGSWSNDIHGCQNNGDRDIYLFKIDLLGNIKWQKLFGGSKTDYASSFDQTSDGGLVIAGGSGSRNIQGVLNHGLWDFYLLKLIFSLNSNQF
jgi:hypothetical protein